MPLILLRKELGFGDGFIISDCNDIDALVSFRVARNISHAAAKGIIGGVDLDLQCGGQSAYTQLPDAIASGLVNMTLVRQAATRVLKAKFALGLFDTPFAKVDAATIYGTLNSPAHQKLALRAVSFPFFASFTLPSPLSLSPAVVAAQHRAVRFPVSFLFPISVLG